MEIAHTANRETKKTTLDIDRAAQSILQAKTNYFPQSSINVISGYPLAAFNFTLPKGELGTYPSTGPIPGDQYFYYYQPELCGIDFGNHRAGPDSKGWFGTE